MNTGTAELTRVADSVDDFHEQLGSELAEDWFLPALVELLHAAGKVPEDGECYTYVTLPVFHDGRYEVDNLNPVPAGEHFSVTGHILQRSQSCRTKPRPRFTRCSEPMSCARPVRDLA